MATTEQQQRLQRVRQLGSHLKSHLMRRQQVPGPSAERWAHLPEAVDLQGMIERRHILLNELRRVETALMEQHQICCLR